MNRWKVEVDPAAERELALDDRYRVVSRLRFLNGRPGLILEVECDEAAAGELRGRGGILLVLPFR
jgi:hypothetical protein